MQFSISRCVRIVIALGMVLFIGQNALAQFGASLQGTVEDAGGNVVSGASVTITNNNTKQTQTQVTGDTGYYRFSELAPGNYNVDVTAANFKKATFSDINVAAETPRNLDTKLAAGGAAETVTVTAADLPQLQTSDASVGGTIDQEAIDRLPQVGRDPYELLRLTPGIAGTGARSGSGGAVSLPNNTGPNGSNASIFQTENQVQISAAGRRVTSNTYLIDGVTVDSLGIGGAAVVTPNAESVKEITVTSSSYNAEDGRNSGAVTKTVTKSGTNQLHGSALFKYDNPGLNAFNRYNGPNNAPASRVQDNYRDYAASLGGPIIRDKLFFFTSWEGIKNKTSTQQQQYLETPQLLATLAAAPGLIGTFFSNPGFKPRVIQTLPITCQQAFGNAYADPNSVPLKDRLCQNTTGGLDLGSPRGGTNTYLRLFFQDPDPATGLRGSVGNGFDGVPELQFATVLLPSSTRGNQFNGRIDYQLNANNLIAGSAYFTKLDTNGSDAAGQGRPIGDISFKPLSSAITVLYIHTFSPSLLNEARANFTRFAENGLKDNASHNFGIPRIQVEGYPFNQQHYGEQGGGAGGETQPGLFAQNTYEVRDTVTKTFGSHTVRTGVEIRYEQDNNNLLGGSRPLYSFSGFFNLLNATPIFEAIDASQTGGPVQAQRYFRTHDISGFIQHDWKVKPNLTLNTGLRYEFFSPLTEKKNQLAQIKNPRVLFGPGASVVPVKQFFSTDNKDFGPKIGFAWSPNLYRGNTVVRGGFGISFDRLDDGLFTNSRANSGFFRNNICCGTTGQAPGDFGTPFAGGKILVAAGANGSPNSYPNNPALNVPIDPATGTPTGNFVEIYGAYAHTPSPYVYLYSLEVQTQFPAKITSTVGYQGSNGFKQTRLVNQCIVFGCNDPTKNPANPRLFSGVFVPTNDVRSNYNGLNANLSRQFANGIQITANYTFSKSLDQLSSEGPGAQTNQTDPAHQATEKGPSDFDVTNRFYSYGLWELPIFRDRKDLIGTLLGHFQINGIFTAYSGFPWTPVVGISQSSDPFSDSISPIRPIAVLRQPGRDTSNKAFKTGSNFLNAAGQVDGTAFYSTDQPPQGRYVPGVGRNSLRGPRYKDVDLSIAKDFPFHFGADRAVNLNIRANGFNVFNFENLSPFGFNANTNIFNGTLFSKPTSGLAGRVLELHGRITF